MGYLVIPVNTNTDDLWKKNGLTLNGQELRTDLNTWYLVISNYLNIFIDTIKGVIGLGRNAGVARTFGGICIGIDAGSSDTGPSTIAIGTSSAYQNSGGENIAIGFNSLRKNSGNLVFAVGRNAGYNSANNTGNQINNSFIINTSYLPFHANHSDALLSINVTNGATPGSTYLYRTNGNKIEYVTVT